jgi:hypothetical protein
MISENTKYVLYLRINLSATSPVSELGRNCIDWLKTTLLRKLVNWSSEKNLRTSVTSLRLVPVDRYNQLYNHLKEKYGKKFVAVSI